MFVLLACIKTVSMSKCNVYVKGFKNNISIVRSVSVRSVNIIKKKKKVRQYVFPSFKCHNCKTSCDETRTAEKQRYRCKACKCKFFIVKI